MNSLYGRNSTARGKTWHLFLCSFYSQPKQGCEVDILSQVEILIVVAVQCSAVVTAVAAILAAVALAVVAMELRK